MVAVSCSELQCVALCCIVLQCADVTYEGTPATVSACTRAYKYICVYVYICIYVYVYMYIYVVNIHINAKCTRLFTCN